MRRSRRGCLLIRRRSRTDRRRTLVHGKARKPLPLASTRVTAPALNPFHSSQHPIRSARADEMSAPSRCSRGLGQASVKTEARDRIKRPRVLAHTLTLRTRGIVFWTFGSGRPSTISAGVRPRSGTGRVYGPFEKACRRNVVKLVAELAPVTTHPVCSRGDPVLEGCPMGLIGEFDPDLLPSRQ